VLRLSKKKKKNRGENKENQAYTPAAEGNPKLTGPNRPST